MSKHTVFGHLFVMVVAQVQIHRQLEEMYEARVILRKGRCDCATVLSVMAGEMKKGISVDEA